MSDYNFYGTNTPVALNTGVCTVTDEETITATNPLGAPGDIVYMKINATQGVVVVVQDPVARGKFDKFVYSNVPAVLSTFTPTVAYYFDAASDLLHSDVLSYKLDNQASIAAYSESYRPYNVSFDYTLIVDDTRRFYNGDIKTLISTTWTVFKDSCKDVAYLVSFAGDSIVTLNNKFKSSLEFNIATR
jgi:hypothetical protein